MNRQQNIHRLHTEEFDLCIIGAGASGAGCALDAALRGLKVALIDQSDVGAETSSKSTKLVHGGVRYLEQAFKKLDFAQLRQVKHGLQERHLVLQNAPHLARPLGLITPVFSWWEGLYFSIGLWLYDFFAARKDGMPGSKWLSKKTAKQYLPGISNKIHSAVMYYDGQLDDARYSLALAQSAEASGAVVVNYMAVTGFDTDAQGTLVAARVHDTSDATPGETFPVSARYFLNCCGPFADNIRHMANPQLPSRIKPSKGVHLVLPGAYFGSEHAMLIPKTKDGRMVFAIPFEGALLLGTTDEAWTGGDQEPVLEAEEVRFLLETLQPFIEQHVAYSDVKAGFGGLRPLVLPTQQAAKKATKSLLRDHEVEHDPVSGLTSLLGGKWTTYRLMAKDAIDFICRQSGNTTACTTDQHLLIGATGWTKDLWKKIAEAFQLDAEVSQHLAAKYGMKAYDVARLTQLSRVLGTRLSPLHPVIQAEVVYAATEEKALCVRDFLARRVRLEVTDWEAALQSAPEVARLMAQVLGWTPEKTAREIQRYQIHIQHLMRKVLPQNPD
jgi:glycerol-3-phosphate dehydrogenase